MTPKEQTAVQWLIEQIMADKTSAWKKEIEQAIEMERQQIKKAWIASLGSNTERRRIASEQYFTDTYQTNK